MNEANLPNLVRALQDLVDGQAQADPKFQTTFSYMGVSDPAVPEALIEVKGYSDEELPNRQTIVLCVEPNWIPLKKNTKIKAPEKNS